MFLKGVIMMLRTNNEEYNRIIQTEVLCGIDRAFHCLMCSNIPGPDFRMELIENLKEELPKYVEAQGEIILRCGYLKT